MKKSMMLVAVLAGVGCQGNPYAKITNRMIDKPVEQKPTPSTVGFICEVPPVIEVAEGANESVKLNCRVPEGDAIVAFEGLPNFIKPDPAKPDVLLITPKVGDGIDPNHPTDLLRKFIIRIKLTSSKTPNAVRTDTVVVLVRHAARGLTVSDFDLGARILEGSTYESTFTVQSADFPRGPFVVSGVDVPPGVVISATANPNRFKVTYKPDYTAVKLGSANNVCYDGLGNLVECNHMTWKLNVVDPRGGLYSAQAEWDVVDVRQFPVSVVPKSVVAPGGIANFYFHTQDPNGEIVPQITPVLPPFGTVKIEEVAQGKSPAPFLMVRVTWMDTPPEVIGTTQSLVLKTCVKDPDGGMLQCKDNPVSVNFQ